MLAKGNVVSLNSHTVYKDIMSYLKGVGDHKEKTRVAYETDIRQFFKVMVNKEIEFLEESDLKFKQNDILSYRHELKQSGLAASTINRKITSIKQLYENLEANEYNVSSIIFNIKRLKHVPNSYGTLSKEEAELMAETVFDTEKEKPLSKHLMVMLAIRTSFREDELLRLKWSDFEYYEGVYKVRTVGKMNKENITAISTEFYEKLRGIEKERAEYREDWLKYNGRDEDVIFYLTENHVKGMMNRLREKLNISKERNIVFHSFRNVAMNYEYERTSDIVKVQNHSKHKSLDTLRNHYMKKEIDYTDTPGVAMDRELEWDFLDGLNIDDFKEFFITNKHKLYTQIKKFADSKNK
ncbi:hypothetical protein COE51_01315 [Bacillus pseudomycoides]|nr:hypothetical protein COE51_01315 [Bacillus pseudomycoides]